MAQRKTTIHPAPIPQIQLQCTIITRPGLRTATATTTIIMDLQTLLHHQLLTMKPVLLLTIIIIISITAHHRRRHHRRGRWSRNFTTGVGEDIMAVLGS